MECANCGTDLGTREKIRGETVWLNCTPGLKDPHGATCHLKVCVPERERALEKLRVEGGT
jgi:hypothetical protein